MKINKEKRYAEIPSSAAPYISKIPSLGLYLSRTDVLFRGQDPKIRILTKNRGNTTPWNTSDIQSGILSIMYPSLTELGLDMRVGATTVDSISCFESDILAIYSQFLVRPGIKFEDFNLEENKGDIYLVNPDFGLRKCNSTSLSYILEKVYKNE